MAEDDNVHDATHGILRKIQADIAAFRSDVIGRLDMHEGRFDKLEGRFDKLEGRFDKLEVEVSALAVGQRESRADMGEIKAGIEDIKETARLIEGRLVRLEKHAGFAKA